MADTYANPIFISNDGEVELLEKATFGPSNKGFQYNESFLQNLAFDYPECIPFSEIDPAYASAVPVCMELNTPAGPLDALYVTPTGRIVVLEAKLWKNPEARRKVVAQVLDYAKELSRWDYEDLQREVSRRIGRQGNALFERVRSVHPEIEEARFVDEVQVSLKRGRFLLLVMGDGIREGAASIADFLESVGNLEFTFGMVELAVFESKRRERLIQPRLIARTVELGRVIVQLPEEASLVSSNEAALEEDPATIEKQQFYQAFWSELLDEIQLDDASQPLANVTKSENIYFRQPPDMGVALISAAFSKSRETLYVYLRLAKSFGQKAYEAFQSSKDEIEKDLGVPVFWRVESNGAHFITNEVHFPDVHAVEDRQRIKAHFCETINRFVNTFRHRLERLVQDIDD